MAHFNARTNSFHIYWEPNYLILSQEKVLEHTDYEVEILDEHRLETLLSLRKGRSQSDIDFGYDDHRLLEIFVLRASLHR